LISNPVVLAAVAVGGIGYTLYEMLSSKDDDNGSDTVPNGSEPYLKPLKDEVLAVETTVTEPLETVEVTVEHTVNEPLDNPFPTVDNTAEEPFQSYLDAQEAERPQAETVSEEAQKKELIRQAMSELGKRSAVARRKKAKN